jgi:hypothetical protein
MPKELAHECIAKKGKAVQGVRNSTFAVQNIGQYYPRISGQYFRGNIGPKILINKFIFYSTKVDKP